MFGEKKRGGGRDRSMPGLASRPAHQTTPSCIIRHAGALDDDCQTKAKTIVPVSEEGAVETTEEEGGSNKARRGRAHPAGRSVATCSSVVLLRASPPAVSAKLLGEYHLWPYQRLQRRSV